MLHVVARRSLASHVATDGQRRLLLEGEWDDDAQSKTDCLALDALFDGRHAWIDEEAARISDLCASLNDSDDSGFYFTNALRLRYTVVKWLRVLAFRRSAQWPVDGTVTVHLSASPEDDEYATLWNAVAIADRRVIEVRRYDIDHVTGLSNSPRNGVWRRLLARVAAASTRTALVEGEHRVLLCGNPQLLGPICDELLRRKIRVAWLFDRFAVRPWIRWRPRGVSFLHCDGSLSELSIVRQMKKSSPRLEFDGVSLSPTLDAWTNLWMPCVGMNQALQRQSITRHTVEYRPTHVVVDEDATPLKRLLISATQKSAISTVVQHGACGIRFGFTPLLADRIVVGNEGSRRQLDCWGVASQRIFVAGTTQQHQLLREIRQAEQQIVKSPGRTILLLCTTPPRDGRPDAVTYHLTSHTYEEMLHWAFTAAAETPDATLVVKPHPRTVDDAVLKSMLKRFPRLRLRHSQKNESLAELAVAADFVLSCASSAGIDVARTGRPVIQLLPRGSGDVLPADWYGLVGSARSLDELRRLIKIVPRELKIAPIVGSTATITDVILDAPIIERSSAISSIRKAANA